MSITLSMISLTVAIGMSLGTTSVAALVALTNKKSQSIRPVPTIFNNRELLLSTLSEHGLQFNKVSENEFVVSTENGKLRYFRTEEDTPFYLEASEIKNIDELLASLDQLEKEYGRNVQAFTYRRVMDSLEEHGMSVVTEEILEDDSVLLRLQI